jgi:predicted nucleic acid-binding protein
MKNNGILLDSDIVIWFLRGKDNIVSEINKLLKIICMSLLFLLQKYMRKQDQKRKNLSILFFSLVETICIDSSTGKLTGSYLNKFSKSHKIEIADTLIATTALNYLLKLWMLNKKHSPKIKRNKFYK